MTASGGGEGEGVKGLSKKGKRTHGHGQQCGDFGGEGKVAIRVLNGNGKKIQLKIFLKYVSFLVQRLMSE